MSEKTLTFDNIRLNKKGIPQVQTTNQFRLSKRRSNSSV